MTQSKSEITQLIEQGSIVKNVMRIADIAGVSVATVKGSQSPITQEFGVIEKDSDTPVERNTVFGAASLSKPVFAYLVLKLVEAGKLTLDMKGLNDILPFKDFCDAHDFKWKEAEEITLEDIDQINSFTPTMILSHTTGFDLSRSNQVNHQFEPGQPYYRYSGLSLFYLQKVIEKMTGATLEDLAQTYVFGPKPNGLGMTHSSFGKNPCAANSLTTTAEDYVLFVQAWMSDAKLQYAFKPQISMTQDPWAKETVPDSEDLKYVAECLGFQLELDEKGKPLTAFKTGDMGPWRGWVVIDLSENIQERRATVYFAKGPSEGNGHILAETLIKPYFRLEHSLVWFKEKYGFATGVEDKWQHLQKDRFDRAEEYLKNPPQLSKPTENSNGPVDSTTQMLHQMHINTPSPSLAPVPEPVRPTAVTQQNQTATAAEEDEIQVEGKFNPSPFAIRNDPYKK